MSDLNKRIILFIISSIYIPAYYYIQYTILKSIGVDRLIWFLFYFSIPFSLIVRAIIDLWIKKEE